MTYDRLPIGEASVIHPAIAWQLWDAAVQSLADMKTTNSPAYAERVKRNETAPWLTHLPNGVKNA